MIDAHNRDVASRSSFRLAWIGAVAVAGLACGAGAQEFTTGFEAPTFLGSGAGTSINGQDSWMTPAVAGSVDGLIFFYEGNTPHLPVNPAGGGDQFLGTISGGGTSFARAQREGITFPTIAVVSFDAVATFNGTPPT